LFSLVSHLERPHPCCCSLSSAVYTVPSLRSRMPPVICSIRRAIPDPRYGPSHIEFWSSVPCSISALHSPIAAPLDIAKKLAHSSVQCPKGEQARFLFSGHVAR
jgi:hypothetical protein